MRKRSIIVIAGIILLGSGFLLGGGVLAITLSQPCGWLDSFIKFTGCVHQVDTPGVGFEVLTRDLTIIAAYTLKDMSVWRTSDGKLLNKMPGQRGVFSDDGDFFIVNSAQVITVWQTQDWILQSTLDLSQTFEIPVTISEVAVAPDMSSLAIVLSEKNQRAEYLRIWQTKSRTFSHKLEGHTGSISSVTYSSDGRLLATGGDDTTIRLWQAEDGRWLHTLQGHKGKVVTIVFAPNGETLASSDGENTIRIWRASDGELLRTLEGANRIGYALAYSADGAILASGGTDGLVQLWNVDNGSLICNIRHNLGIDMRDTIETVAFSPDDKMLATVQSGGLVRFFNVLELVQE